MAKHHFVNEITKHLGDSSVLVTALLAQISTYGTAEIEWHVRPNQAYLFTPESSVVVVDDNDNLASSVKSRVIHLSQNGAAGSVFHVSSYDRFVLGATTALNGPDLCVVGHHLGELARANAQGPQPPGLRSPHPYRGDLSFSDAVAVAKRVLTEGGHTSREKALHQKDLRPRMVWADQRTRKNTSDPSSVSLITQIVHAGTREGWLRQESRGNGQTGYEFIWLVTGSGPGPSTPIGYPPSTAQNHAAPSPPLADRTNRPPATASEEIARGATDSGTPQAPHQDQPQLSSAEPPLPKTQSKYSQSQSKQMEDILRSRHIGTHPRTRRFFYDAFRAVLAEDGAGLPLPKLRGFAVEKAISAAGSTHTDKDWRTASRCFLAMMVGGGALLSHDKKRILPGPCTLAAIAVELDEKPELRAESFLIELIIETRGGLRENELYSAGLALYQTGGEDPVPDYEIETRVASILELLLSEHRIQFDGERYSVHPRTSG